MYANWKGFYISLNVPDKICFWLFFSPTNVEIVLILFLLYFINKFPFSVFFSFPLFKIPEAYFIRDPHTFLLTKDFIKVYMFFLVQKTQKLSQDPNYMSSQVNIFTYNASYWR